MLQILELFYVIFSNDVIVYNLPNIKKTKDVTVNHMVPQQNS